MGRYNKIPKRYWAGCYKGVDEEQKDYKYLREIDKARELRMIQAIMKNGMGVSYGQ